MNTFHKVSQNQFKELFKTIIFYDEEIDILRKQLFAIENFSPIDFFHSLDVNGKNFLSLTDFSEFLSFHNISFNTFNLRKLIRTYDKNNKFTINFDDFLNFIKPKFPEENPQSINNNHPNEIYGNILIEELNLIDKIGQITFKIKNTKDFNVYEAFMNISKGNNYLYFEDIKHFLNEKYIKDSKIKNIIYRIDLDYDNKVSYEEFKEVFFPNKNYLINGYTYTPSPIHLSISDNYQSIYSPMNTSMKNKIEEYILNKLAKNNSFVEKKNSLPKLNYNKTSPSRNDKNSFEKISNNNHSNSSKTLILDSLNNNYSKMNHNKPLNLKQLNLSPNKNLNYNSNSHSPFRDISISENNYEYNKKVKNPFKDSSNTPHAQDSIISRQNNISSYLEERKNCDKEKKNNKYSEGFFFSNEVYEIKNNPKNIFQNSYEKYINQNNNLFNPKILDTSLNEIMFDKSYLNNNLQYNNNETRKKRKNIIRYDNSNADLNGSTKSFHNKNNVFKNNLNTNLINPLNHENTINTNQDTIFYPDTKKMLIENNENNKTQIKEKNKENKDYDFQNKNKYIIYFLDFIIDKISKKNLIESLKETLCLQQDISLPNLFYIFDTSKNEKIKKENFIEICNKLKLFPTEDQIYLLYKKYDLDNDDILNYEEFCHMILPLKDEYLSIIKNRQENIEGFSEISKESNIILKELIKAFIQVESYFYELKNTLKLNNFSCKETWNLITHYSSNDDRLSKNEFKLFLEDNNTFLTQFEIDLIFNDMDLDNDGIINFNDFEREIII